MYERCPHCNEYLWIELGYNSPQAYIFQQWINYAYPHRQVYIEEATEDIVWEGEME